MLACFFSTQPSDAQSALNWKYEFASIYYVVVLVGILATIVVSYYQSSLRERQQLRLFAIGVVLAVVPFLFLTVLPEITNPNAPLVDPQLSTLSVLLLPLSLGYSILRYQLLVLDAYVRRAIAWLMGIVFLAVLSYRIVTFSSFLFKGPITQTVIVVAAFSAILAPCAWWAAKRITDRLFFDELRHYRRIIDAANLPLDRAMNVAEAARVFTLAVTQTFEVSHVCLFVLNEGAGAFDLAPPLRTDLEDEGRGQMLHTLLQTLQSSNQEYRTGLTKQQPAIERIAAAQRPLLLSEAGETKSVARGLDSYFVTSSPGDNDPLLVPVWAQGRMIGLLVLGEREDQQPYAGPDFGVIRLLLARFSTLLETARLYARANEHAELLNKLYRASAMPGTTFQSVEEVASIYASVAASATLTSAELWLYDKKKNVLSSITVVGSGPYLTNLDTLKPVQKLDWHSWFYEGRNTGQIEQNTRSTDPPCLLQKMSDLPYAWLPLQDAEQCVGLLTLTYAQPHFFLKEEMHVLEMFAVQCASALANAKMTMELRQAYERQKELDHLKDEFIS
ncbi:MAG TPA: GAF domain-containing protein, partial [Ktedonobacteraceae bacterium]|nr:GAF domain-containing protein [Ktedonobacteraceae bacterium]